MTELFFIQMYSILYKMCMRRLILVFHDSRPSLHLKNMDCSFDGPYCGRCAVVNTITSIQNLAAGCSLLMDCESKMVSGPNSKEEFICEDSRMP